MRHVCSTWIGSCLACKFCNSLQCLVKDKDTCLLFWRMSDKEKNVFFQNCHQIPPSVQAYSCYPDRAYPRGSPGVADWSDGGSDASRRRSRRGRRKWGQRCSHPHDRRSTRSVCHDRRSARSVCHDRPFPDEASVGRNHVGLWVDLRGRHIWTDVEAEQGLWKWEQVSMLQNFFPPSLTTRPNKLECLYLARLSSLV